MDNWVHLHLTNSWLFGVNSIILFVLNLLDLVFVLFFSTAFFEKSAFHYSYSFLSQCVSYKFFYYLFSVTLGQGLAYFFFFCAETDSKYFRCRRTCTASDSLFPLLLSHHLLLQLFSKNAKPFLALKLYKIGCGLDLGVGDSLPKSAKDIPYAFPESVLQLIILLLPGQYMDLTTPYYPTPFFLLCYFGHVFYFSMYLKSPKTWLFLLLLWVNTHFDLLFYFTFLVLSIAFCTTILPSRIMLLE